MRTRTSKLRNLVATYWQPAVFYGLLIVFFGLLSWFQLGKLLGGYSSDELTALGASNGFRLILENPVNAPFNIIAHLLGIAQVGGGDNLLPLRAAATFFGLLTLTTFYWLVRHWHGERSAILGTIAFGCSAWFLHTTRFGTADVLLFALLGLVACSVWLKKTHHPAVLLATSLLAAALLYVPGMVWMVLVGLLWQGRTITRLFKEHTAFMIGSSLGLLLLISPLVWAMFRTPETALVIAGLPADGWPKLTEIARNLANVPLNLFARGPLDAEHWLGRLPVLDAFSIAAFLLGAYLYLRHWRLVRSKIVATALVVGGVLIGLGGSVSLSILISFVYILIAAGIGFLLDRWQHVFPRNVIAQVVGVGLVSLAVITVSWYGLRQYFVAWPNAPATKQVFTIK